MLNGLFNYVKDSDFRINIYHNKVNIVNYLDIISLEENRISINYSEGSVVIKGKGLKVIKLLDNEVLITGVIRLIEMG